MGVGSVAGYAGPLSSGITPNVVSMMSPSSRGGDMILASPLVLHSLFRVFFAVGIAMTFRDVRRRLTNREESSIDETLHSGFGLAEKRKR
jgi:hypothetical protein